MDISMILEGNIILYPPKSQGPQNQRILLPTMIFSQASCYTSGLYMTPNQQRFVVHLLSFINSTWVIDRSTSYVMVKISGKQHLVF